MFYTFGNNEIWDNINTLTKPFLTNNKTTHAAYNQFLIVNSIFEVEPSWEGIKIEKVDVLARYAPLFHKKCVHYFKKNNSKLAKRILGDFFINGLNKLKRMNIEIYTLATFLIRLIIVNHLEKYINGTLTDTLGVSIMDFKDHFKEEDFIELIFHQLIHMSLFLDDLIYPHMKQSYKNELILTNLKYVRGGNSFPAYIAFHSYTVGLEMLCFRKEQDMLQYKGEYHGTTKRIIRVTSEFQRGLLRNKHLFLHRGIDVLERGEKVLSDFPEKDFNYD